MIMKETYLWTIWITDLTKQQNIIIHLELNMCEHSEITKKKLHFKLNDNNNIQ